MDLRSNRVGIKEKEHKKALIITLKDQDRNAYSLKLSLFLKKQWVSLLQILD